MEKSELKPCRCGSEKCLVLLFRVGILHHCRVYCLSGDCRFNVIGRGLTAKQAERRARRAWDRRVGNE